MDEAVEYCKNNGIEFYAVNKNYPEEEFNINISRKIDADIYIDDKNLGGFPGWSEVWQKINPDNLQFNSFSELKPKGKTFISKIRNLLIK